MGGGGHLDLVGFLEMDKADFADKTAMLDRLIRTYVIIAINNKYRNGKIYSCPS